MWDSGWTRRRLLRSTVLTVAALPALVHRQAGAQSRVDPSSPQAQSLHYKHDADKVDHPDYQEGELCSNCQFYQAGPDQQWAPCIVFGRQLVNADGWCTSYVPKA